jgi:hypothetical protein
MVQLRKPETNLDPVFSGHEEIVDSELRKRFSAQSDHALDKS